jgi:putative tryptophan/tyrosine transport system permease protein
MNIVALSGALELGLLYGLVAFGVYLSFRVLDFPDLTVDGSFPLGGAVAATLIVRGMNPWEATLLATSAGMVAGLCTAALNVQFKILNLLASILTMIGLYSINLRIMGQPNLSLLNQVTVISTLDPWLNQIPSVLKPFSTTIVLAIIVAIILGLLNLFFATQLGLALRATGANPGMARAQGIDTDRLILLGLAIGNGLVALAGALFVQINGFADVQMGVGTIVFGLVAVIIGESLTTSRRLIWITASAIVGSILYRVLVAVALNADFLGLQAQDLNLITSVLVAVALILPQSRWIRKLRRSTQHD